jgi:hypothetical protein
VPDVGPHGHQLAAAVAVDAFALRTVLAPAVMHVCGRANWWLPRQLDRRLPHLAIEPPADELPARAGPRLTAAPRRCAPGSARKHGRGADTCAAAQHELSTRQPDQRASPVARSRPATRHDLTARPGRRASQVTAAEAASRCPFLPSCE